MGAAEKILKQITAHKIWYGLIPYYFGMISDDAKDKKMKGPKLIKKFNLLKTFIAAAILLSISGLAGCDNTKPIKVGFVGCLTGRLSELGTDGRNGAVLAVENVNKAGGINNRVVELIIKDDKHDPEVAIQVDKELLEDDVVAIVGHMTSAMSTAVVPLINKEKILMISPTTSTNKLAGMDDYFFRVMPVSKSQSDHLAEHAIKRLGLRKVAAVYDKSNRAYTEGLYVNFKSEFENMGGKLTSVVTFTSGQETSYLKLTRTLIGSNPDGLLIVASALDTAMICQQLRKLNSSLPVLSVAWAKTSDLIRNGGPAVEGIIISITYNEDLKDKNFFTFKEQFNERFGKDPDFGAVFSYEATQILLDALSKTDNQKALKGVILNQSVYQGLQGEIRIDKFGDVQRKGFLVTVKDGRFVTLE